MPTCEKSPDGEHHYLFDDITFDDLGRYDHYRCAYCGSQRQISKPKKPPIDKLKLPTDADLDKK